MFNQEDVSCNNIDNIGDSYFFISLENSFAQLIAVPVPGYFNLIEKAFETHIYYKHLLIRYPKMVEKIDEMLELLPPREKKIIELRYLIFDGTIRNYSYIERLFNIKTDDIKEIEDNAFNTLRKPKYSKAFKADFLTTRSDIENNPLLNFDPTESMMIIKLSAQLRYIMAQNNCSTMFSLYVEHIRHLDDEEYSPEINRELWDLMSTITQYVDKDYFPSREVDIFLPNSIAEEDYSKLGEDLDFGGSDDDVDEEDE